MTARYMDISVPIRPGMHVWPTDPPLEMEPAKDLGAGGSSNVTRICMGTHTGTHVDPPRHFIDGGRTVDELDLEVLCGECVVVEDLVAEVLDGDRVARLLDEAPGALGIDVLPPRVLFKTRSSQLWRLPVFNEDYVSLDTGGAEALLDRRVRLVGVDYLSVERKGGHGEVHRRLLEAGLVVVEGLDLSAADPGVYELLCLPLRIAGGDGAPARAVLRRA
jgi:arylformamidase